MMVKFMGYDFGNTSSFQDQVPFKITQIYPVFDNKALRFLGTIDGVVEPGKILKFTYTYIYIDN